jgi:PPK2 family polyphosphate:nucleotide phosphotransferase
VNCCYCLSGSSRWSDPALRTALHQMKDILDKINLAKTFQAPPGKKVHLDDFDPAWTGAGVIRDLRKDQLKEKAAAFLQINRLALAEAQELLWACDRHSVLIILQGMDTSGKDGVVKHVMSGVNPQGCSVHSFKKPSDEELDHTFLWRIMKATPERGKITVFNRSHYEDVIVTRVHPEILELGKLPPGKRDAKFWNGRYEDINGFEHHLHRNGTFILKFFLHVSKKEQKRRLLARLDDPHKQWKFAANDVAERRHWSDYMDAYERAINATSTEWAPWWIVPADHKFITRAVVASIITRTITSMKLSFPEISQEQKKSLAEAKRKLMAE